MRKFTLLLGVLLAFCLEAAAGNYNVRDFGARGDGRSIDSEAINKAILKASDDGGGTVIVPSGTFNCYSIRLKSHVTLYLEKGAVIRAAAPQGEMGFDDAEDGPMPQYQDFGHSHFMNSLIWGIGLEDVAIMGEGMIDGSNLSGGFGDTALAKGVGNKSISLKECRHVTIRDITIFKGGHFCLLATGVDDLKIQGITVDTMRDGLDIDCCRNVRVSDCLINSTFDDGLVLKASYALERFVDTQDVTITGVNLSAYATGSVLDATYLPAPKLNPHTGKESSTRAGGRIKLGTESSGGFKNIAISSCTFAYCGGILIESMDGGHVENVVITGITMRDCTDSPLFIRLGERMRSPEGTPVGHIKGILISDLIATNSDPRYGMILSGTPNHRIQDVTLRNLHVHFAGGVQKEEALKVVPENEKAYPDPWMFGGTLPSWGMFLRHMDGLRLEGVHLSVGENDTREAIIKDDIQNVTVNGLTISGKALEKL